MLNFLTIQLVKKFKDVSFPKGLNILDRKIFNYIFDKFKFKKPFNDLYQHLFIYFL